MIRHRQKQSHRIFCDFSGSCRIDLGLCLCAHICAVSSTGVTGLQFIWVLLFDLCIQYFVVEQHLVNEVRAGDAATSTEQRTRGTVLPQAFSAHIIGAMLLGQLLDLRNLLQGNVQNHVNLLSVILCGSLWRNSRHK